VGILMEYPGRVNFRNKSPSAKCCTRPWLRPGGPRTPHSSNMTVEPTEIQQVSESARSTARESFYWLFMPFLQYPKGPLFIKPVVANWFDRSITQLVSTCEDFHRSPGVLSTVKMFWETAVFGLTSPFKMCSDGAMERFFHEESVYWQEMNQPGRLVYEARRATAESLGSLTSLISTTAREAVAAGFHAVSALVQGGRYVVIPILNAMRTVVVAMLLQMITVSSAALQPLQLVDTAWKPFAQQKVINFLAPRLTFGGLWKAANVAAFGIHAALALYTVHRGARAIWNLFNRDAVVASPIETPNLPPVIVQGQALDRNDPKVNEMVNETRKKAVDAALAARKLAITARYQLATPQQMNEQALEIVDRVHSIHSKRAAFLFTEHRPEPLPVGETLMINQDWHFEVVEAQYAMDRRPQSDRVVHGSSTLVYKLRLRNSYAEQWMALVGFLPLVQRPTRWILDWCTMYHLETRRLEFFINHETLSKTRRFLRSGSEDSITEMVVGKDLSVNAMLPELLRHGIHLNRDGEFVLKCLSTHEVAEYQTFH